eukprot:scaffold967_cov321-Pavlova_lutheri.AAC.28
MNRAIARFLTANCHGHLRLHRDSPSDARLNRSWLERARFPRNPVHAAKSRTLVQSNKVLIIGSFEPYVSRGSPPTVLPNVRIRPQYVRGICDPLGSDGLGGQGASGRGVPAQRKSSVWWRAGQAHRRRRHYEPTVATTSR